MIIKMFCYLIVAEAVKPAQRLNCRIIIEPERMRKFILSINMRS